MLKKKKIIFSAISTYFVENKTWKIFIGKQIRPFQIAALY
jgi:hypothetical protein